MRAMIADDIGWPRTLSFLNDEDGIWYMCPSCKCPHPNFHELLDFGCSSCGELPIGDVDE